MTRASWRVPPPAETRRIVQGEVASGSRCNEQKTQSSWLGVQSRSVFWSEIWRLDLQRIGFYYALFMTFRLHQQTS
ncbi:hypothetical protein DPMN_163152 [Dreissena polymorpha]|uniref:Uncharacterized protein n=1 Tax=Dreissena polymorpha TaxID=45954 RepID=A0A9D4ESP1_DREPO|nr:hypothetical protein DPMN_163152 [Dreissena polymorpha]